MSKGSKPRPMTVSYKEYVNKWEKVFGDKTKKDRVDEVLKEVAENAFESMIVPENLSIEEISERIKKNNIELLNDRSLEYELERMKTGHA
jgi:hypothetical protein